MSADADHAGGGPLREIVVTRTFAAPRELVFEAWTRSGHVVQWWGPDGFTNPVCELEARPGGAILIHMQAPDGAVYPIRGVFHAVEPPKRLSFTIGALPDTDGRPRLALRTSVTFAEERYQTLLTLRSSVIRATADMAGPVSEIDVGWSDSLSRLAHWLAIVKYGMSLG